MKGDSMNLMTGHPLEIANLTGADLVIVLLMIVVFVLALVLPYPGSQPRREGRRR